MCAIAGATAPDDQLAVARILQKQRHRGPDGSDVWTDPDGRVTLGCARLATTDQSSIAQQPIQSRDGRFVLAFNGYIAGHRRLIAECMSQGTAFKSQNDAELVLHLLAQAVQSGRDVASALEKLSGQYALAFWDCKTGCLWLARDPLGIKPLYVMTRPGGGVAFSSELGALEVIAPMSFDQDVKAGYFAHLFVPAPKRDVSGIELLSPGTVLSWQVGETARSQITHPANRLRPISDRQSAVDKVRQAVRQSVADALDADCVVGALVSGGLDSAGVSTLACDVARERGNAPPLAFVMGFDDPLRDETAFARNLCRYSGQELHVIKAPKTAPEIYEALCDGLRSVGAPFANPSIVLMQHLSEVVGNHVRVCLAGDGGDELFGGYPRYRAASIYHRYWQHLPGGLRRLAASLSGQMSKRNLRRFLVGGAGGSEDAFDIWNNRCAIPELNARLSSSPIQDQESIVTTLVDRMMQFDRDVTLPGNQLVMSDRCGMAHGLEYRLPLLGHDVVAIASMITADQHQHQGVKSVWREAIAPYLPKGHAGRSKIGFNPPIEDWLAKLGRYIWGDDESILAAIFDGEKVAKSDQHRYWQRAISGRDTDMSLSIWALLVWQVWVMLLDDGRQTGSINPKRISDMGVAAEIA
ncbi:asparagine synthase (glutamine-hydrolyzing) [Thalassospira lucentensis]|uniref:asparagine synthase (glutamine-hydrolyzing) n=1 Tax=Thalassospira lucentensis TaxID=168935 RepID=UPI003D2F2807